MSRNGRWVLYGTGATNMGPTDTDWDTDGYVYDVQSGTTRLVSRHPDGSAAGGVPTGISDDGRIVSFDSQADDLVAADTDKDWGAYLFNAATGKVRLVSRPGAAWPDGVTAFNSGVSGSGRYLTFDAFPTPDPYASEVYLFDRRSGQSTRVSVTPAGGDADAGSGSSQISHAGNRIVVRLERDDTGAGRGRRHQLRRLPLDTHRVGRVDPRATGRPARGVPERLAG